mgnify:CR=1 FL=1
MKIVVIQLIITVFNPFCGSRVPKLVPKEQRKPHFIARLVK